MKFIHPLQSSLIKMHAVLLVAIITQSFTSVFSAGATVDTLSSDHNFGTKYHGLSFSPLDSTGRENGPGSSAAPSGLTDADISLEPGFTDFDNLSVATTPESLNITLPPVVIKSSCKAFIDSFSETAADFVRCTIRNARPLHVCMKCVEYYLKAVSQYDIIMKGFEVDESGSKCGNMILNADRVQIITHSYQYITSLWKQCACNNCFKFLPKQNDTAQWEIRNETLEFEKLTNETYDCFRNHTKGFIVPLTVNYTDVNMSIVCDKCQDPYSRLNKMYRHLEEKYGHAVCIDIVDSMNATRILWSHFDCTREKGSHVAVILLSVFFTLLPVIFYVANRLHGTKLQRKIVKQKRLRNLVNSTEATHS